MGFKARQIGQIFVGFCLFLGVSSQHILTPTYFNVAEGKEIYATATCGEGFAPPGERYCKLTGNTADVIRPGEQEIIQGQYCDYCDENDPVKYHPINQAIDGTEKWWQSPPLSRSTAVNYNDVNVTIDLGQLYHIAYIIIKSANSPRPGRFILERSTDYGRTYRPWQYFAGSDSECLNAYGMKSISDITNDDDVICTAEYSNIVPLEDGEIVVSLVNGRPGSVNFSYSETLQEWTKATNIRLRLQRTNTLLGHLMGLARQDPTVTRRYYYSIKDISIGGRCVCNGHADTCDTPGLDGRLICTCSHNTCGTECEYCCPGFVQKKWKQATLESSNECEPCNCHGHTSECYYDEQVARERLSLDIHGRYEGGGVCVDCQHNTTGVNCERCMDGYYREGSQPLDSPFVCQPCDCDPYFSTGNCAPITGQCECRPQFAGANCDECSAGYYDFPSCKPCDCNVNGTADETCQANGGQCPCKPNYFGQNCDLCAPGYYNFPECIPCDCNRYGSLSPVCHPDTGECRCRNTYESRTCGECQMGFFNFPRCEACSCSPYGVTNDVCNKTDGSCICKDNFGNLDCGGCDRGYYNFPFCLECNCDEDGSLYESCTDSGQCYCRNGFAGQKCNECDSGYFRYPDCLACNCSRDGSLSLLCDDFSGECTCRRGYQSRTCEMCEEGFYNYPNCEECNCNPAGVIDIPGEPLGGCGQATQGACRCKDNVIGRTCDSCSPRYFNLVRSNPAGCEACDCFLDGTIGGLAICDMSSGQCLCKAAVDGRRCEVCKDGYYRLRGDNAFGCVECGCDIGGSIHGICDKETGQCICRPRVTGRTCKEPAQLHFFPSLHQIKFEIESGYTPDGGRPRIGFDPDVFPGFSYLGYAVMSNIQPEVLVDITVDRTSIYRIVIRYMFEGGTPEKGRITVTPSSDRHGSEQTSDILFIPGPDPQFVTVEGGGIVMPFVLNPGEWTIKIMSPEGTLLDYLVLLPSAFYEASVLIENVADPCIVGQEQDSCNYYVYPSLDTFPNARGVDGYYFDINTNQQIEIRQFLDEYIMDEIDVMDIAHLDEDQSNLYLTIPFDKRGDYVFIVEYYGGDSDSARASFEVLGQDQSTTGFVNFYNCSYLCRSIVINADGEVQVFTIEEESLTVSLTQIGQPFFLGVSAIIAIPVSDFSYEFITPTLQCIKSSTGECIGSTFPFLPDASVIDLDDPTGEAPNPPNFFNPSTTFRYISAPDGPTTVIVHIRLPPPGRYVFVVHYYQPYSSGFEVDFKIPGEVNSEGSFNAKYCPHVSGCRVTVTLPDGTNVFDLTGKGQSSEITIPGGKNHQLWIDYILAIPEDQFSEDILNSIPEDRAGDFITYCANNEYYIGMDAPEICQEGVFSISTEFNNGAQYCDCDTSGSLSLTCERIGGQCPCRDNIIGRRCDRCSIGYYSFPLCRPCNCPNNICNEETGECICPENVVGANCDQCRPGTYGYDALAGCIECECDERGIETNTDDVCNVVTGQCRCKANVGGRRCDQCEDGHYQYPFCLECDCDPAGTIAQICDQTTSQCLCKDNVVGDRCDQCAIGSFNLDEENSQGCISCFCFGVTEDCRSYTRNRADIGFRQEWQVTNLEDARIRYNGELVNVYVHGRGTDPALPIYWIPPTNWLGSKLTSYGGYLTYRVHNNPLLTEPYQPLRRPDDVTITGNGIKITYTNVEQPLPSRSLSVSIKMVEDNFHYTGSSRKVSRVDFLMVLADVDDFRIRAQYFDNILDASLSEVMFDVTRKDGEGEKASSVERCRCPPEYMGTSCEQCAPGHYRINRGTFLGQCVPCQCNNHSNECDPETGTCENCQDNTEGAQCQKCRSGYHGNGTNGDTCEMCACPRAEENQNFAETCEYTITDDLICNCIEGHIGQYCERCGEGYYGDPSRPYGFCRRCDCSGNTDTSLPGPECDSLYGNCLKCHSDTTGENCEHCADWYYGDAKYLKNCQTCDCDRLGSESCNRTTGECHCKPNVVGERCDQCAAFHYDFESGNGCTACGCAVASVSFQCDLVTGVCDCQNGVEGDKCDKCTDGFFGYTQFGCDSCRCPPKLRCDPENGECICPPGATGPLCDQCEDRFVLTDEGCLPCDDCVHELLDILDEMDFTMNSNNSYEFNVSVSTNQVERLQEINQTMHVVKNKTGVYELNNQNMGRKLMNSTEDLDALKDLARKILKQGSKTDMNAREMAETANATLDAARAVADKLRETMEFIQAQANLKPTGSNESLNIADMLAQARGILEEIRARNHSQHKIDADMEHEAASELLQRALSLHNASQDLLGHVRNVSEDLDGFTEKVNELKNLTSVAGENVKQASAALGKNFTSAVAEAKRDIKQLYSQAQEENDQALDLIELADAFLEDAKAAVQVTAANASTLDAANNKMDNQLANLESAYNSTKDVVSDSEKHAANLTEQADLLEGLLVSTKESADNALQAANAYSNIVAAIEDAEKAALNAMNASSLARQEADLFGTQPADSLKQSNKLVTKGQKANKKLQDLEDDLTNAAESVNEAMGKLDDVQSDLSEIERGMMAIPSASSECDIRVCGERDDSCRPGFTGDNCNVAALSEEALEAKMQAMDASMRAEMAAFTVSQISGELDYLHDLVTVTIPDYIDETNIEAAQAQAQVTQGREIMASFQDLEQTLHDQHTSILNISKNVLGSLDELREMIGYARTLAQGIQVAAKLESDSILQLRAPVVEEQPQSVTSISMYFQTKEPNSLLFYGAAPDPSNGYVAIELVDGEAVFKFNLGDSYVELPLGINVADGQWHQLVAERNGKYGQLTIYSSGREKQEATIKSPGVLSLLKFADDFGLFVGGLFDNYTAPDTVNINPFVGGIDDVRFNQAPLGIWNFANAANVDEGILRNATDLSEVPDPDDVGSTLFDGNGFVKIANPSAVGAVFTHTISFKTLAPEGLIMFARKGSDFLSLELEGGKIVLRVSIDGETRTLRTSKKYNNNKWTLVYISNFAALSMEVGQTGRDQEVLTDEFETTEDINPMKYLYYGGLVGIPDDQYQAVTRRGFLGCMKGILVIRDAVNLNKGMRSKGIFPNCIAQDTRLVSFPAPYGGFVRLQPTDFYEAAELSLNFRALRSSGLIAYFSDDNHVNVMALQLVNGSVEAVFGREGDEITRLVSNLDSYDNGEWHSVSVSKVNSREVSLVVDDVDQDFGIFRTRTNVVADGLLFIGGLPSTIVYNDKAITSLHPFVGCISNVAVGVELKNFANRLTDLSANYNICPDVAEIISEPHPEIPTTRQYATTTEGISEECKLGLLMSSAADPMDAGAGFFGATNESRYEYQGLGREYITDDEMTFGLKTAAEFGVLYYNSDSREFDFTTLYLFGGKLVYSFNYGSGDVEIESSIYVNDNQWHQVKTVRSGSQGTIFVDDVKVGEGQLTGSSRYLSVETPLYVGGLPGDWRALDLPPESRISLIGCIKDFTVIPPRAFLSEYEVAQCRGSREPGVFFGQFGGYLVLDNSFSVGVTMEVSLEIKPRKNTGTIFSVQKEAMDFMSLEMRSGELFLTIENGRGEFTATFSPDGGIFSLCDGEWHSVTVMKSGNVAYIEVDGVRGIVAEGNPRSSEANTNDPLYFGGIPINMIHDGIVENENYVGCMRKVMINGIRQDISSKRFVGDVDQRSCPAN